MNTLIFAEPRPILLCESACSKICAYLREKGRTEIASPAMTGGIDLREAARKGSR